MTTAPVQVMPAPKKPFQINPALINSLYHALLKTDLTAEGKELTDAWEGGGVGLKWRLNSVRSTLPYYQAGVKSCEKRQYTTEDQKNAGCLGTDTLDQCSIKLFNHCLSKNVGNAGFLNAKKNMLEAADRLDKALKAYTVKLKMIPEPK